ncbi:hypothetical protein BpHYR1_021000 [Brachionus plicatilis]|uniref:Uncharacterized protein n=1 Tax=Brachionus plicatilis TaxID=10195 RepID=A0A3M7RLN3_BRAPC|nr:hypothetical protein BpHYR1_021000 [Brachionus plicatilis]
MSLVGELNELRLRPVGFWDWLRSKLPWPDDSDEPLWPTRDLTPDGVDTGCWMPSNGFDCCLSNRTRACTLICIISCDNSHSPYTCFLKRVSNIYPVYHLNPASANMRELFNLKFIKKAIDYFLCNISEHKKNPPNNLTRSEKKRVITPKSRIRSVSHLSNLRYPLLAAKHARSILNARGNPFNKNGRAFKSWETSKILVNLELCSWSLDFMYQSVMAFIIMVLINWPL